MEPIGTVKMIVELLLSLFVSFNKELGFTPVPPIDDTHPGPKSTVMMPSSVRTPAVVDGL